MKKSKITLTPKLAFIYKLSMILGTVSFFSMIPITLLIKDQVASIITCYALFFFTMLVGVFVLVFSFVVEDTNGVMSVKTKAEKYSVSIKYFEDFYKKAEEQISSKEFAKICDHKLDTFSIHLFAKRKKSKLTIIMLLKTDELTNDIIDESDEEYVEILENYYGKSFSDLAGHITVMTLICVDRLSNAFKTVLNSNVWQDFNLRRVIAGISFGGKKLYIAQQKTGIGFLVYKAYKKDFLDIFNFLFDDEANKEIN